MNLAWEKFSGWTFWNHFQFFASKPVASWWGFSSLYVFQFPGLGKQVHGEEDNEFVNTLGERIVVEIMDTEKETAALLNKVVSDEETARLLLIIT